MGLAVLINAPKFFESKVRNRPINIREMGLFARENFGFVMKKFLYQCLLE